MYDATGSRWAQWLLLSYAAHNAALVCAALVSSCFDQIKKHNGVINAFISTREEDALREADVVYTDSWMSYKIPAKEKKRRLKMLKPFQVNQRVMSYAQNDAVFMHCLPATRGIEVTNGVMDSPRSLVYDQAENRTYAEKAVLMRLLGRK